MTNNFQNHKSAVSAVGVSLVTLVYNKAAILGTMSAELLNSNELFQDCVNNFQRIAKIWDLDIFQDNFRIRWKLVAVFGYIVLYLASVSYIVVTCLDDPIRILKSICFVGVSVQLLVKLATILIYKKELLELHQRILNLTKNSRDRWEKTLFKWIYRFTILSKFMFGLYLSSAILFLVYPIHGYVVLHEKLMIVDFVLPFVDEHTTVGYVISITSQFFQVLNTVAVLYLVDVLFLLCIFLAASYEELVEQDCECLSDLILKSHSIFDRPNFLIQQKFPVFLIDAIKRNEEMDEYVNQIKLIFESGCLVQLACAGYTLMLSLVVVKVTDWFVIYLFAAAYLFQHILYSSSGTLLESMTENLPKAIYDIPWHHLTVYDQKVLLLFLQHSQQNKKFYLMGRNTPMNIATGIQMTILVVETFENDKKDVFLVSSNWFVDNTLFWPPKKVSRNKSQKTLFTNTPDENWEKIPKFKILQSGIESLELANSRLNFYMRYTNTDSEIEEQNRTKLKRKHPLVYAETHLDYSKEFIRLQETNLPTKTLSSVAHQTLSSQTKKQKITDPSLVLLPTTTDENSVKRKRQVPTSMKKRMRSEITKNESRSVIASNNLQENNKASSKMYSIPHCHSSTDNLETNCESENLIEQLDDESKIEGLLEHLSNTNKNGASDSSSQGLVILSTATHENSDESDSGSIEELQTEETDKEWLVPETLHKDVANIVERGEDRNQNCSQSSKNKSNAEKLPTVRNNVHRNYSSNSVCGSPIRSWKTPLENNKSSNTRTVDNLLSDSERSDDSDTNSSLEFQFNRSPSKTLKQKKIVEIKERDKDQNRSSSQSFGNKNDIQKQSTSSNSARRSPTKSSNKYQINNKAIHSGKVDELPMSVHESSDQGDTSMDEFLSNGKRIRSPPKTLKHKQIIGMKERVQDQNRSSSHSYRNKNDIQKQSTSSKAARGSPNKLSNKYQINNKAIHSGIVDEFPMSVHESSEQGDTSTDEFLSNGIRIRPPPKPFKHKKIFEIKERVQDQSRSSSQLSRNKNDIQKLSKVQEYTQRNYSSATPKRASNTFQVSHRPRSHLAYTTPRSSHENSSDSETDFPDDIPSNTNQNERENRAIEASIEIGSHTKTLKPADKKDIKKVVKLITVVQNQQRVLGDQMAEVQHGQKTLIELFSSYIARQNKKSRPALVPVDPAFVMPKCKIATVKEIKILNKNCLNESYVDQMVIRLKRFVSTREPNFNKSVKSVMEHLFSYELILLFSWTGMQDLNSTSEAKYKFQSLSGVISLITKVCSFHLIFTKSIGDDVEKSIKNFIRRAKQNFKRQNESMFLEHALN